MVAVFEIVETGEGVYTYVVPGPAPTGADLPLSLDRR